MNGTGMISGGSSVIGIAAGTQRENPPTKTFGAVSAYAEMLAQRAEMVAHHAMNVEHRMIGSTVFHSGESGKAGNAPVAVNPHLDATQAALEMLDRQLSEAAGALNRLAEAAGVETILA